MASLVFERIAPGGLLIAVLWVVGLLILNNARSGLPWQERGEAPESQGQPRGHSKAKKDQEAQGRGEGTGRAAAVFRAAALVTLAAGVVLERSGDAIAGDIGMGGVLFGATFLLLKPLGAARYYRAARPSAMGKRSPLRLGVGPGRPASFGGLARRLGGQGACVRPTADMRGLPEAGLGAPTTFARARYLLPGRLGYRTVSGNRADKPECCPAEPL